MRKYLLNIRTADLHRWRVELCFAVDVTGAFVAVAVEGAFLLFAVAAGGVQFCGLSPVFKPQLTCTGVEGH